MSIIYCAINKINNKVYIGKTNFSLKRRKRQHLRYHSRKVSSSYFHNAIRRYGCKNFIWRILHRTNDDNELNKLEQIEIKKYQDINLSYNIALGGTGGDTLTKHPNLNLIKQKISKKTKGCNNPMFGRHRYGSTNPFFGKTHSDNFKLKLSKIHKDKIISEDIKKKMSVALFGRKKTVEHRQKIAAAHIGLRPGIETCNKISKSNEKYLYEIISPNDNVIVIKNLNKFCKENELCQVTMRRIVKYGQSYKGWTGKILQQLK